MSSPPRRTDPHPAAILIIGAPGSGKSSVIQALSNLLAEADVEHGALETEIFAWGHPWLTLRDTLPHLHAPLTLQRNLGRRTFLLTATPETDDDLEQLVATIGTDVFVAALRAPADTVAARVLDREPPDWSGRRALADAARRLAASIPTMPNVDLIVDTDRDTPADAAHLIYRRASLRP